MLCFNSTSQSNGLYATYHLCKCRHQLMEDVEVAVRHGGLFYELNWRSHTPSMGGVIRSLCGHIWENSISWKTFSIARIWYHQILVLSVFCLLHSYVNFADTRVTKATDLVNHTASQSTQGGQPSSGITSVLVEVPITSWCFKQPWFWKPRGCKSFITGDCFLGWHDHNGL